MPRFRLRVAARCLMLFLYPRHGTLVAGSHANAVLLANGNTTGLVRAQRDVAVGRSAAHRSVSKSEEHRKTSSSVSTKPRSVFLLQGNPVEAA